MTEQHHGRNDRSGDHDNVETTGGHPTRKLIKEIRSSAAAQLRHADDLELELLGRREEERAKERRRRFRIIRGGKAVAGVGIAVRSSLRPVAELSLPCA